jgi:hypothetical protein
LAKVHTPSQFRNAQRTAALDLNQLLDATAIAEFPPHVSAARAEVDRQRKLLLDVGEAICNSRRAQFIKMSERMRRLMKHGSGIDALRTSEPIRDFVAQHIVRIAVVADRGAIAVEHLEVAVKHSHGRKAAAARARICP